METRKVQVTGGSTYTVSLPKWWATEHGVSGGSVVEMYPEERALVVVPRGDDAPAEGRVDVSGQSGEELLRTVVTMYVSGFDVVTLEAGSLSAAQSRTIRDAAGRLSGLEIIEESAGRVRLRDLLDHGEVSTRDTVARMRVVATTMLADAVRALVENDDGLAAEVAGRDDDIDRMYALVVRTFRASLREPAAHERSAFDRETYFDYHSCARQLERVGDHAAKIAGIAGDLGTVSDEALEAVDDLHGGAAGVIDGAVDAFFADDPEEATRLANDTLADLDDIDAYARDIDTVLRDLDPEGAQLLGLVVDSLSRSAEYGGNIAEAALQRAAPRP